MRATLSLLALACLLALALPATAQQSQSDRIMRSCMLAFDDQAYCQCTSKLLLDGLSPEEMSMFLAYMEAESDQDSDFLYSMLPNDKISAIFDQAEIQCRTTAPTPAVQGDEKQRMVNKCLSFGDEPAYCECVVTSMQQQLTPDEFLNLLLSMEADTEEQEMAYLDKVDGQRLEAVMDEAEAVCAAPAEHLAPDKQQNLLGDAKIRMVRYCESEGDNPGDCQCLADELAKRLSAEDIHLLLDTLAAEEEDDFERADWLRTFMDQDKLNQSFDQVEKACGIDF